MKEMIYLSEYEFSVDFTDISMIEADGKYDDLKRIMDRDLFDCGEWMISSQAHLNSQFGTAVMELHFYHNKDIFIMSFNPSGGGDVFYNPDIICLSMWANENGWNRPEPHRDLVDTNEVFWKHFWETSIVKSRYLEKKYPNINIDYYNDEN